MENNSSKTVVVGMSGGVDSSVAALLLKQAGYRVIGLFMKNWEEESGACSAAQDYDDVVRVADQIGIPYYTVNFSRQYWDNVFTDFLEESRAGFTPNPDILCNREIKFKVLLDKALELGGDYLATGHYCRNLIVDGQHALGRGLDKNKDQSYFLCAIKRQALEKVLFPLGDLQKSEIRAIAHNHGLTTASKKDSTGICFIGERNFKQFLSQFVGFSRGDFETPEGKVVGEHDGVAYYTIGQRKGIGIGGPGEPWFVVGKDVQRNVVIVAQGENHPALYHKNLVACQPSWIGEAPAEIPYRCTAKIRYRHQDEPCEIIQLSDDKVSVIFDDPQRAITPGQSVVFYQGDICLGGAVIREIY
ncbi:MAG: tRNA 2-thiouridine(34) synthase MnmA [Chlamydiota bacterium]